MNQDSDNSLQHNPNEIENDLNINVQDDHMSTDDVSSSNDSNYNSDNDTEYDEDDVPDYGNYNKIVKNNEFIF